MGIYIPGIDMPTRCTKCPCSDDEVRYCLAANEWIPMLGKPEFCPLVEIPAHGRLVDADKLCKVLKALAADEWNQGAAPFSWSYAYDCMADTVDTMPTVIPEEGEA